MKKKLESILKQLAYDLKYILVSSFIFRCLMIKVFVDSLDGRTDIEFYSLGCNKEKSEYAINIHLNRLNGISYKKILKIETGLWCV